MDKHITQEEKKIRQMTEPNGRNNPFLVPEGYFDALPGQIMQRIQAEGLSSHARRRPRSRFFIRLTAAAVLTGFFTLAGLMLYEQNHQTTLNSEAGKSIASQEIEYSDEALDYVMLDNSDIEYYLTVAE